MCNTPSIISANSENVIFESANVSQSLILYRKTCLIVVIMSTMRSYLLLEWHKHFLQVAIIRYGHANDINYTANSHSWSTPF